MYILDNTSTDFQNLPADLVWCHVLPKMQVKELRKMCELALAEGKHEFVRGMIIPAFMQRYMDPAMRYNTHMYACMTSILQYMIYNWSFEEVRDFFSYYGLSEIECVDYQLFQIFMGKEVTSECWKFVIPNAQALASAHHLAVNMNDKNLVNALETNVGRWQPYHVWCAIDMKKEHVFEYYLESAQIYDEVYCEMRISMLQAASGQVKVFEQVFCLVSLMEQMKDLWIQQSLKDLCNTMTITYEHWIHPMIEIYSK